VGAKSAIKKATNYMLRECGHGNACACEKVKRVLATKRMEIMAGALVTFAEAVNGEEHVNKLPFKGVLLLLDVASTKPPHGSRGHRIYVPKKVAEEHLDGLVGMAVNYDRGDLDSHDTRHKVGIVTKAWISGDKVWVSGFVWKRDFPEAAKDLKQRGLGMSMELANVFVRDEDEDVWHLEDFEFTGATILKKSAAAYYGTELAAQATAVASGNRKGEAMAKTIQKENKVAAASTGQGALLVQAMQGAMSAALAPVVAEIRASNERFANVADELEELKGLHLIQAAKEEDDDDEEMSAKAEEDDDEEMSAASKKDEEDSSDDDSNGEEEDLDAMEDLEEEAADEEPGELNKDAKNLGDKKTVTDPPTQKTKVPGGVSEGRLKSSGMHARGKRPFPGLKSASIQAAAVQIQTLQAQVHRLKRAQREATNRLEAAEAQHQQEVKKLRNKVVGIEAQAQKWAEQVNRRSVVPVEIRNLMAKANVDPHEILAGAQPKLPVEAVDQMFSIAAEQGIVVDTTMKAAYKSRMYELGLMEAGEVSFRSN
jgi:hypothetical protein